MNNNTVQNQEQTIQKDTTMNDCDYLNDILMTEKNMASNYITVLNEVSNNYLYNELFNIYQETQDCQRDLFNLLFKKGWYKLEKADPNKITTELNEHEPKLNELPQ